MDILPIFAKLDKMLFSIILRYSDSCLGFVSDDLNPNLNDRLVRKVCNNYIEFAIYAAVTDFFLSPNVKNSCKNSTSLIQQLFGLNNLNDLIKEGSEILGPALVDEFDAPKFKKPDVVYRNVRNLSVKHFKTSFIKCFSKHPLFNFHRNFTNFANNYAKELFRQCYNALTHSSTSFGFQAYNIEYNYLKFGYSAKKKYKSIQKYIGKKSDLNKLLNNYEIYVHNQIVRLGEFQKKFNGNNKWPTVSWNYIKTQH